jgi:hypothetical protein
VPVQLNGCCPLCTVCVVLQVSRDSCSGGLGSPFVVHKCVFPLDGVCVCIAVHMEEAEWCFVWDGVMS